MSDLYDSDNPDAIPDGVLAAGYTDGYAASAWKARGFTRFPNARRINVFATTNDGDTFDCESHDITPDQVPGCVLRAHARGVAVPWAYVNRDNGHQVETAMQQANITKDQVALWIATLDGTQVVTHWNDGTSVFYNVAAVQYANSVMTGHHYDLSILSGLYGPGGGELSSILEDQRFTTLTWRVEDLFTRFVNSDDASPGSFQTPPGKPAPGAGMIAPLAALMQSIHDALFNADGTGKLDGIAILKTDIQQFIIPVLTQLEADIKNVGGGAIDPSIATSLEALKKHLGVGTP